MKKCMRDDQRPRDTQLTKAIFIANQLTITKGASMVGCRICTGTEIHVARCVSACYTCMMHNTFPSVSCLPSSHLSAFLMGWCSISALVFGASAAGFCVVYHQTLFTASIATG